jgi:hypothetical protein
MSVMREIYDSLSGVHPSVMLGVDWETVESKLAFLENYPT